MKESAGELKLELRGDIRFGESLVFAGLLLLLLLNAFHFRLVQDDAFITFRYVRNFIQGQGLVFNPGERVEGYSNFLWLLLLALPARLGLNTVSAARIIGLASSVGTFCLLWLVSRGARAAGHARFISPGLYACNGAVAYWAGSGLETPFHSFLLTAALLAYAHESPRQRSFRMTPVLYLLLALSRPEGGLFFVVTAGHFVVARCRDQGAWCARELRRLARLAAGFAVPFCAYLGWRAFYYGTLLPNTYHAKAATGGPALAAGAAYIWSFLQAYAGYGLLFMLPAALLIKGRRTPEITCRAAVLGGQLAFVMLAGGDLLPAFRFFVPVLPIFYLLLQDAAMQFTAAETAAPRARFAMACGWLAVAGWTIIFPYAYLRDMRVRENGLVGKMTETGLWLRSHAAPGTVLACSTIGALAYHSQLPLVDMLGLTDAVVARSRRQIPGLQSSWKERRFDVDYLLGRQPDWIFFSTGIKPSAYAERALFLNAEFRSRYYPAYFHPGGRSGNLAVGYKRGEPRVDPARYSGSYRDVQFINYFYDGMNSRGNPGRALQAFERAAEAAPADFALLYQEIGFANRQLGRFPEAESAWKHAAEINPAMIESRIQLGMLERERGRQEAAKQHFLAAARFNPEFAGAWALLGEAFAQEGSLQEADAAFRRALSLAPDNLPANEYLRSTGRTR